MPSGRTASFSTAARRLWRAAAGRGGGGAGASPSRAGAGRGGRRRAGPPAARAAREGRPRARSRRPTGSPIPPQHRRLVGVEGREVRLRLGLFARPVPGGDLAVGVEGAVGSAHELVLVEGERALVALHVLARELGIEIGEAEDVARELLRVGVLLDEEAERALGGGGALLERAALLDHEAGGHRLQALLLGERPPLPPRPPVARHHLAPRFELPAPRGERAGHVGGFRVERRGVREGAGLITAILRARCEWGGYLVLLPHSVAGCL